MAEQEHLSPRTKEPSRIKRFFKMLGPGLVASIADSDPTSIGTCAVAGASLGVSTLWWIIIHFPLTAAVQNLCARIGLRSGLGLTEILTKYYSRRFVYFVVVAVAISNIITLGADLGAVADAVAIFTGTKMIWIIVPVSVLLIVFQVF